MKISDYHQLPPQLYKITQSSWRLAVVMLIAQVTRDPVDRPTLTGGRLSGV